MDWVITGLLHLAGWNAAKHGIGMFSHAWLPQATDCIGTLPEIVVKLFISPDD